MRRIALILTTLFAFSVCAKNGEQPQNFDNIDAIKSWAYNAEVSDLKYSIQTVNGFEIMAYWYALSDLESQMHLAVRSPKWKTWVEMTIERSQGGIHSICFDPKESVLNLQDRSGKLIGSLKLADFLDAELVDGSVFMRRG